MRPGYLRLILLAASACRTFPSSVVIDDTARPRGGEIGCTEKDEALTYEERLQLEQIVFKLASKLSSSVVPALQVRVVCAGSFHEFAAARTGTIDLSARAVRWVLNEYKSQSLRELTLSFMIGHELGHLVSPVCSDPCAKAFDCERRADEVARKLAGWSSGTLLLEVAERSQKDRSRLIEKLLSLMRSCRAGDCREYLVIHETAGEAAAKCLADAEMQLRYIAVVKHESKQGAEDWDSRRQLRDTLEGVSQRRNRLGERIELCSEIVDVLPANEKRVCLRDRVEAVRAALVHAPKVPELTSPSLRSPESHWHGDALLGVSFDSAPSWKILFWGDDGMASANRPTTDSSSRVFVGYEGGMVERVGLRLGYSRWRADPDASANATPSTFYTVEFIAEQPRWFLGDRIAVLRSAGLGGSLRQSSGDTGVGFLASLGGRIAFRVLSRIHVSAGIDFSFHSGESGLRVSFPVALDVHLGRY